MTSKRTTIAIADRPAPTRKRLHRFDGLVRLAQAQPKRRLDSPTARA